MEALIREPSNAHTKDRAKRATGGLGGWPPGRIPNEGGSSEASQGERGSGEMAPRKKLDCSYFLEALITVIERTYEGPSEASHGGSGGLAPQEEYQMKEVRSKQVRGRGVRGDVKQVFPPAEYVYTGSPGCLLRKKVQTKARAKRALHLKIFESMVFLQPFSCHRLHGPETLSNS